ncbi:hypothetical protein EST38_g14652 [Candolleomyces aberdarensis]|uniref:Uncharacterized protein n=1 Tax=Candolleomyces aberdarensis TaxID=2316362 RepID=A0A4Q2CWU3_9AGAR|nr:hypothetical protein EST38_g14652 [Candolleomyces aberdarensis]
MAATQKSQTALEYKQPTTNDTNNQVATLPPLKRRYLALADYEDTKKARTSVKEDSPLGKKGLCTTATEDAKMKETANAIV